MKTVGRNRTELGDPLTARQKEVLEAVRRLQRLHGVPPTLREIGREVGLPNTTGVVCHLTALVAKGSIRKVMDNSARIYVPVVPEHCCPTCGRRLDAKEE